MLHDDSLFSQIVRNVVWHLADPDSRTKKRKHERLSGTVARAAPGDLANARATLDCVRYPPIQL